MGETKATIYQTLIVIAILAVIGGISYILIKVFLKLLGLLILGVGIFTFVFIPGKTKVQSKAFANMFLKIGAVMVVIGIIIIVLG